MSIELMWQYFLSPEFVQGAWMTLLITLCSLLCGVVLGLVLALLQEAPFRAGRGLAFFYLWLFRGTPVLFQIIFVYNVLPGFGLRSPRLPVQCWRFRLMKAPTWRKFCALACRP